MSPVAQVPASRWCDRRRPVSPKADDSSGQKGLSGTSMGFTGFTCQYAAGMDTLTAADAAAVWHLFRCPSGAMVHGPGRMSWLTGVLLSLAVAGATVRRRRRRPRPVSTATGPARARLKGCPACRSADARLRGRRTGVPNPGKTDPVARHRHADDDLPQSAAPTGRSHRTARRGREGSIWPGAAAHGRRGHGTVSRRLMSSTRIRRSRSHAN